MYDPRKHSPFDWPESLQPQDPEEEAPLERDDDRLLLEHYLILAFFLAVILIGALGVTGELR